MKQYGGLLYLLILPANQRHGLEWDMKLWWPHAEALYALLLAYHLSGAEQYARWFEQMHEWTFAHFPDPEIGGWYGYLHRDGSTVDTAERRDVEGLLPYAARALALLEAAWRDAGVSSVLIIAFAAP